MININLEEAKNFAEPAMDKARKTAINNITKQDLEESFKLHEKKLIELSKKLSSQTITNNDDYHPQTE